MVRAAERAGVKVTSTRANRTRKAVEVTLSAEAIEIVDALAAGYGSRSAAVEALIHHGAAAMQKKMMAAIAKGPK